MDKKKYHNTQAKNNKWIQQGRGLGQGSDYKPWLTVRDLGSEGRSHRIFGHITKRTHHLLSDLELSVFLLLEWNITTTDIREQFPLQLDTTIQIATESQISHPSIRGALQIMTSDFLVNTNSSLHPKFVLQAKYAEALQDIRTIEKLEIERRYWQQKDIPWMLVTEKDIPSVVLQNIQWLYPAKHEEMIEEALLERTQFYSYQFNQNPNLSIINFSKKMDTAYELDPGQSLYEIRQLLAQRLFQFNISVPIRQLTTSELKLSDTSLLVEAIRVSS